MKKNWYFTVYHWILTVEFLSLPSNSTNCMEFTQSPPLQMFMHLPYCYYWWSEMTASWSHKPTFLTF